jgi:hypothetical protein
MNANDNRTDKREQVLARVRHSAKVANLDMREQVRDALFSQEIALPLRASLVDMPDCESVTIEHYVSSSRMVRKTEEELRAEIRRVRASRLRNEQHIEQDAREHGFGQRMSGVVGL